MLNISSAQNLDADSKEFLNALQAATMFGCFQIAVEVDENLTIEKFKVVPSSNRKAETNNSDKQDEVEKCTDRSYSIHKQILKA